MIWASVAVAATVPADVKFLGGDMKHLLGINGSGSVKVVDSRLWSVPVFRALFSQLGLESTSLFDSIVSVSLGVVFRSVKIRSDGIASGLQPKLIQTIYDRANSLSETRALGIGMALQPLRNQAVTLGREQCFPTHIPDPADEKGNHISHSA